MTHAPHPISPDGTCHGCGITTSAPELLLLVKKAKEQPHYYCPPCRMELSEGPRRGLGRFSMLFMASGVLVFTLYVGLPSVALGYLVLMLVIYTSVPVAIIAHELGHALAARACGWKVHIFNFGSGRLRKEFRLGHTLVQVRRSWKGGYVIPTPDQVTSRFPCEAFSTFAAGPVANLLCFLAGLTLLLAFPYISILLKLALGIWMLVNGLMFVVSLAPKEINDFGFITETDGQQLVNILKDPDAHRQRFEYLFPITQQTVLRLKGETAESREASSDGWYRNPGDPVHILYFASMENLAGNHDMASRLALRALSLLDGGTPLDSRLKAVSNLSSPAFVKAALQNVLARAYLQMGVHEDNALQLTREAYEVMPWSNSLLYDLGLALARNGYPVEGLSYIEKSKASILDLPPDEVDYMRRVETEVTALVEQARLVPETI